MKDEGAWQPIETAPKDGAKFLARWIPPGSPTKAQIIIAFWSIQWEGFFGENVKSLDGSGTIASLSGGLGKPTLYVTHWMPLPPPPTESPQ